MLLHGTVGLFICFALFYAQEWIPVITRDIIRQRRQAPQPSLSDAYMSGMPSKRRKVTVYFSYGYKVTYLFSVTLDLLYISHICCIFYATHLDSHFLCHSNCKKSSPKSFGKSCVTTRHGKEWTHPLHVPCPLQTSPVTQPLLRYVHTTQTDTQQWHIPC